MFRGLQSHADRGVEVLAKSKSGFSGVRGNYKKKMMITLEL